MRRADWLPTATRRGRRWSAAATLAAAAVGAAAPAAALADSEVMLTAQTDGVNGNGVTKVALYCNHAGGPCSGSLAVKVQGKTAGHVPLDVPSGQTSKVAVKLSTATVKAIRKHHRRLPAVLSVTLSDGTSYSHAITLKI